MFRIVAVLLLIAGAAVAIWFGYGTGVETAVPRVTLRWSEHERAQCLREPSRDCILTWATVDARAMGSRGGGDLAAIAAVWPKPELFDEAVAAGRLMVSESSWMVQDETRYSAFVGIAASQAEAGLVEEALATTHEIKDRGKRAGVQMILSGILARAGRIERALEVALNIEESGQRSWAIARVITSQARNGRITLGLDAARRINDWPGSVIAHERSALRWIAGALAKVGMTDEAVSTAARIRRPGTHAHALAEIAFETASAELLSEALTIARGIKDEFLRDSALGSVAPFLAKSGRIEGALAILLDIEHPQTRDRALATITPVLAEAGMTDRALALLTQVADRHYRAAALVEIAATPVSPDAAPSIIEAARSLKGKRDEALRGVAAGLASQGMLELAITTAEAIHDADRRADTFAVLAGFGSDSGLIDRALGMAPEAHGQVLRISTLKSIAEAQAELGLLRAAVATAAGMTSDGWRVDTLTEIARRLSPGWAPLGPRERLAKIDVSLPKLW